MDVGTMNACATCKYSGAVDAEGGGQMLECWRYPPTVTALVVPGQVLGSEPRVIKQSMYPNVSQSCGEYAKR